MANTQRINWAGQSTNDRGLVVSGRSTGTYRGGEIVRSCDGNGRPVRYQSRVAGQTVYEGRHLSAAKAAIDAAESAKDEVAARQEANRIAGVMPQHRVDQLLTERGWRTQR